MKPTLCTIALLALFHVQSHMEQNYPNLFNPETEVSHVKLTVYDMLGREVAELHSH
jgi:hypothetical protein